jgi:hypothetical protein
MSLLSLLFWIGVGVGVWAVVMFVYALLGEVIDVPDDPHY